MLSSFLLSIHQDMKVLIIEDEPLGVERLKKQLAEIDHTIQVAGVTESISASVHWLQQHAPPDLILMDIELADGQSFDIFRKTEVTSPVIFTTSYDEYTLLAFKVNSIDYLLKPIKKEELRRGIEKFRQLRQQYIKNQPIDIDSLVAKLRQQGRHDRSRFLVKKGQRLVSVDVESIAYFYIEGRLTFFKTWDNNKFVVDYSLDELSMMLKPDEFNRLNRIYLVHTRAVHHILPDDHGKLRVELNPPAEKEVLISRESASVFKKWMGK